MVKEVLGNILNCDEDIIVHQVNIFRKYGKWLSETTR